MAVEDPLGQNEVRVLGQVGKAGKYTVPLHVTVLDVIQIAGGFGPTAKRGAVQLVRATTTGGKDLKIVDCITPASEVPAGLLSGQTEVQPGDMIFVPDSRPVRPKPSADDLGPNQIRLLGQVDKPGVYSIGSQATVWDVIRLGNSFTSAAKSNAVQVIRSDATGKKQTTVVDCNAWGGEVTPERPNGKFPVLPGDTIFVPEAPR